MNKNTLNLKSVLSSWGADDFSVLLTNSIGALPDNSLPLQQGISQGDMASERPEKITIMNSDENDVQIIVKLGVFFTEIISGCSCGDEPESLNGYCEMELTIDKQSGDARFQVTA